MFKKFTQQDHVASFARVKASKGRKILSKIREQYPLLEEQGVIREMFPDKKSPVMVATCRNHLNLIVHDGTVIFYQPRDCPYVPTLRMLYNYPGILKSVRVDKGAIKPLMRGSSVFATGFRHPASELPDDLEAGEPVAIFAEGKQFPFAVGVMVLSSEEVRAADSGNAIECTHYLDDGLWKNPELE